MEHHPDLAMMRPYDARPAGRMQPAKALLQQPLARRTAQLRRPARGALPHVRAQHARAGAEDVPRVVDGIGVAAGAVEEHVAPRRRVVMQVRRLDQRPVLRHAVEDLDW